MVGHNVVVRVFEHFEVCEGSTHHSNSGSIGALGVLRAAVACLRD